MTDWTVDQWKSLISFLVLNSILLSMFYVWLKLSLKEKQPLNINNRFIIIAAILAGQETLNLLLSVKDLLFSAATVAAKMVLP
jgi:hypothetical protein